MSNWSNKNKWVYKLDFGPTGLGWYNMTKWVYIPDFGLTGLVGPIRLSAFTDLILGTWLPTILYEFSR